jgi:flagellar biosynthesis protein FlhF
MEMDIRTFSGRTMKDALAQVRSQLGPEAVILQSRETRKRRLFGLAATYGVEITAGTGLAVPEPATNCDDGAAAIEQLGRQVTTMSALLHGLCRRKKSPTPDLPHELAAVYAKLIDGEIRESIASDVVCQLRDELSRAELGESSSVAARLQQLMQERLRVAGPIVCEHGHSNVVAVAGPTGAGKTSAVAKLAASFKLRQNLRVGLVTFDTHRIAAVEQLRTYAEIIDVPLRVVTSPRDMAGAINELGELDLVLVDTPGRSPRDEIRVKELKAFLIEAGTSEVHLVLSAAGSFGGLMTAIDGFAAIGVNRLLFTKLDEAPTLGAIVSATAYSGLPVGYLAYGQDVPDNIDVAEPAELAERVVEGIMNQSERPLMWAA